MAVLLQSLAVVTVATAGEQPVAWKSAPDADLLQSVYPQEALDRSVEGSVRLDCRVTSTGKTRDCAILSESPADYGFGQAALSLADSFEFYPARTDGTPVETAHVRIPVTFSPPPQLTHIRWKRQPSEDDISAAYPALAVNKGATGAAVMNCFVTAVGTLTGCRIMSQTPGGLGFGDAALDLSALYVLEPTTAMGESVAGGAVSVEVNFNIEGTPPVGLNRLAAKHRLLKSLAWTKIPSADRRLAAYAASDPGKSADGLAVFRCHIAATGALERCRTLSASGYGGVEGAARRLLAEFQAPSPADADTSVDLSIHLWPGLAAGPSADDRPPLSKVEFDLLNTAFKASAYLPRPAVEAGLKGGWATVDCVIDPAGAPTRCRASAEEKPGLGLGEQAVAAVSRMRIGTWNSQGEATVGRAFRMTMVLQGRPPE